ncbi:MAG TPA: polyprenyl diphosphate synthase [Rickettsiales bacterium]|nr:polyprenyl diphosphate synthase [Rickettsiales bacterium]
MQDGVNRLNHLAIIMDGNRRWAEQMTKTVREGHEEGAKRLSDVVDWCIELGIKCLTLFAFSTENWKREKSEIDNIMSLLRRYLKSKRDDFLEKGVKIKWIGVEDGVDRDIIEDIRKLELETKDKTVLQVNVAFNYGGRREILDATKRLCKQVKNGIINIDDIDEMTFRNNLYYGNIVDPDLIIRTGGTNRVSNFLLWEMAYSEFFFADRFWPAFDKDLLSEIINNFEKRERRYGGTTKKQD